MRGGTGSAQGRATSPARPHQTPYDPEMILPDKRLHDWSGLPFALGGTSPLSRRYTAI